MAQGIGHRQMLSVKCMAGIPPDSSSQKRSGMKRGSTITQETCFHLGQAILELWFFEPPCEVMLNCWSFEQNPNSEAAGQQLDPKSAQGLGGRGGLGLSEDQRRVLIGTQLLLAQSF